MIRLGIIGAGLIGRERLFAVKKLAEKGRPVEITGIFDANAELCQKSAREFGAPGFCNLEELMMSKPDWIIVSLPHDAAVQTALEALKSGASVLLEKPMGRDLHEARRLMQAGGERLRLGFNYRYYPGIRKALQDARTGRFGKLIAVEILLGHGCGPGQEKTWKLDEERAGGGCLIDPGIHLLDLCTQLFSSELKVAGGTTWSGFWNTGIEEEVSLVLSAKEVSVTLQISIVRWLSEFRMCIRGIDGYGVVTGRNRSYGPQKYVVGSRWGWRSAVSQAASEVLELESEGMDVFVQETEALLFPDEGDQQEWPRPASAAEGLRVMELLDDIRLHLGLRRVFSQS
jgi:predicted dehydrogenase